MKTSTKWFLVAVAVVGILTNVARIQVGDITWLGISNMVVGIFLLGLVTADLLDNHKCAMPLHQPSTKPEDEEYWRSLCVKGED